MSLAINRRNLLNGKYIKTPIEFKIDSDGCFICINRYLRGNNQYPCTSIDGKQTPVHRFIYEQCFGEIPEGMVVMHKCDNHLCINPEHLILGTQLENMQDCTRKKRNAFGEHNGHAKLTEQQVICILRDLTSSNEELACKFNISTRQICSIRCGKSWKYLSEVI
jgi:hypothetical protein